ncbi:hypothetical protein HMPREF0973_01168 [Prevotella veroralis F0319]|uniref:Uncharacterized protein n=1 Tax=Prevotella veroralis F0319 TaxID=649761 RepID=C9MNI1_9BACT|nr:hypothetical protein HMPREF0973_01168 [Prevotella veroralis F0319]
MYIQNPNTQKKKPHKNKESTFLCYKLGFKNGLLNISKKGRKPLIAGLFINNNISKSCPPQGRIPYPISPYK